MHWDWWLSLTLVIVPWIIWLIVTNKKTYARFMLSFFFILIISSWLDFFGVSLGLWYYSGKVIPTLPSYITWDFSLIPVTMTILMQIKPHISPLKKAIVYSTIVSFIGEPFFERLGFYTMENWEYIYSFPIYIIIYLCGDWVSKRNSFATLSK
ncbi:CBO0543 family protein [Neobacillus sp. M.A.Huq-85]